MWFITWYTDSLSKAMYCGDLNMQSFLTAITSSTTGYKIRKQYLKMLERGWDEVDRIFQCLYLTVSPEPQLSATGSQVAERIGNRASNQMVAGLIPHHFIIASGECPCTYWKLLWIRVSAKWLNVNVMYSWMKVYYKVKLLVKRCDLEESTLQHESTASALRKKQADSVAG